MSRLFEKEMHFHVKVEEEKKTLERQADFNTVACFTILDAKNFGYIDFDALYGFMSRYDKEVNATAINAILRRMNDNEDFKIDFREFAANITPLQKGFVQDGCITPETDLALPKGKMSSDDPLAQSKFLHMLKHDGPAFNLDLKKEILRNIEKNKKTVVRGGKNDKAGVAIRNFKKINRVAEEFKQCHLKKKVAAEYLVDITNVSPFKSNARAE